MQALESYKEENQLTKANALEKAVSEYLGVNEYADVEDNCRNARDDLIAILSHLDGASFGDGGHTFSFLRRYNNNSDNDFGNREPETFRFDKTLLSEVNNHINHPDTTINRKCDLFERSIHQMLTDSQDERIDDFAELTADLANEVRNRVEQASSSSSQYITVVSEEEAADTIDAVKQSSDDLHSDDVDLSQYLDDGDEDELSPSLEECRTEGEPFDWETLKTVSRYAHDFQEEFRLHPSRVSRDIVKSKPDVIVGLAQGVARDDKGKHISSESEVKEAIKQCSPSDVSEDRMYHRKSNNYPAYIDLFSSTFGGRKVYHGYKDDVYFLVEGGVRAHISHLLDKDVKKYSNLNAESISSSNGIDEDDIIATARLQLLTLDDYIYDVVDDADAEVMKKRSQYLKFLSDKINQSQAYRIDGMLDIPQSGRYVWEKKP
jgi:hypothetical protein